jgi:hypothetical protein
MRYTCAPQHLSQRFYCERVGGLIRMKETLFHGLPSVPVPFSSRTVRIAVAQFTGPAEAKPVAFVNGRETFVWVSEEEVLQRRRKLIRTLEHVLSTHPGTNLVVVPEYSLPVEAIASELQAFAGRHGVVIIAGSDNVANTRGRIYNQCPVFIPNRQKPIWIRKRELSQWEIGKVDPARDARNPVFTWKHDGTTYWFSVHICLDFLSVLGDPVQTLPAPGFFVVPMCSPDVSTLRTYADSLLRSTHGRACILANATDVFSAGNSCVMAVTPTGKLLEPAIELPREGEFVLVVDLDCGHLVPPKKSPAKPITPLSAAWHLYRIVTSVMGYDFRPETAHAKAPSIGIINPEIFALRGVRMRLAFLTVLNYTEIADRNRDKDFEILAVLGQEDVLVSHLAPDPYDFAFDIRQMAANAAPVVERDESLRESAEDIPHFEVDRFYKVLGREVTAEDRRVFRRGKVEPSEDELKAVFALGENWDATGISTEEKRRFLAHRWLLGDTRRIPGDVNAIMTISLDQAGRREHGIFDLFEREVLPEIVKRSEITSVYAGSGKRTRIDYVLRVTAELSGLYPLIEFVHRVVAAHRIMVTTTTYVVVHRIASLALAKACSTGAAGKSRYLYYHVWHHLENSDKRRFQELTEEEQNGIIRLFERAERALLSLPASQAQDADAELNHRLELLARALVTGHMDVFAESFGRMHAPTEIELDQRLGELQEAEFAHFAAESNIQAGKVRGKLTYGEKIRILRRAVSAGQDVGISGESLEALSRTVDMRNNYAHQKYADIRRDQLVAVIEAYAEAVAARSA